jgi:NADH-quinone oxidoreductase subunit H
MIMLRWTIPRFRFDQLMELAWKVMIPLSLANLVMVMCLHAFWIQSNGGCSSGSLALFAAWGTISAKLREAELAERPGYVKRRKKKARLRLLMVHGAHH